MNGCRALRILFVVGSFGIGGAEKQTLLLMRDLVRRGFHVEVFCIDLDGPLLADASSAGVRLHTAGWNRRAPAWRRNLLLVYSQWRLVLLAARLRPDVLHAFLPLPNFMGAFAGWLTRTPLVVTSRRALGNHQAQHWMWRPVDRISNRLSHRIVANSQAVAADTVARDAADPAKIEVIYNGVDTGPFHGAPQQRAAMRAALGCKQGTIAIGCVANLIPYKGHVDLIAAFAAIAVHNADLMLLLVGHDYGIGGALAEQAASLGVAGRVSFLGARSDVPDLLASFDIAVLPSHEEGFSNALLEMLSAGVPVIATAVGGNVEALAEMPGCALVPARDPAALSAALRRLAADLPEPPHLPARRRELVERRYSVAAMVDNYERLYRRHAEALPSSQPLECSK